MPMAPSKPARSIKRAPSYAARMYVTFDAEDRAALERQRLRRRVTSWADVLRALVREQEERETRIPVAQKVGKR